MSLSYFAAAAGYENSGVSNDRSPLDYSDSCRSGSSPPDLVFLSIFIFVVFHDDRGADYQSSHDPVDGLDLIACGAETRCLRWEKPLICPPHHALLRPHDALFGQWSHQGGGGYTASSIPAA